MCCVYKQEHSALPALLVGPADMLCVERAVWRGSVCVCVQLRVQQLDPLGLRHAPWSVCCMYAPEPSRTKYCLKYRPGLRRAPWIACCMCAPDFWRTKYCLHCRSIRCHAQLDTGVWGFAGLFTAPCCWRARPTARCHSRRGRLAKHPRYMSHLSSQEGWKDGLT